MIVVHRSFVEEKFSQKKGGETNDKGVFHLS